MKYAIIGGGIGGLTTALAFEKKGIDYEIFESAKEYKSVGAGIWLAPNALQVLDKLGILSEIKQAGNSIDRITIAEPDLTPISDSDQKNVRSKFGYSTIAIHRAELQKVLLKHIPENKIHLGKSLRGYHESSGMTITLEFEDETKFETEFLVGADGINSKIRNQLFPESKTRYSGQTCWRGIAEVAIDSEFKNKGIETWGNQIRFGLSKIHENKVYWFAVATSEPNLKILEMPKNDLLEKYSSFHPIVKKLIESTPEDKIIKNDIKDLIPLKRWYKNNICLIGDAGHATTPNMGQGGAQAIEDAYFLAQSITEENINPFESFYNKRRKKVNKIVSQSWSTGKIAHIKRGRKIRNFILKKMPNSAMEKALNKIYSIDY